MLQLLAIALLLFVKAIQAEQLTPRSAANCAFLSNKIYCYGGNVQSSTTNDTLYVLDINSNNGSSYQNLISQWTSIAVPQSTNIDFGKRSFSQAIPLPDGKQFLFHGGYSSLPLVDQTIIYNSGNDSWSSLPNYSDASNGGTRQIFNGSLVYIPDINGIGFYGGYQEYATLDSNFTLATGTKMLNMTFTDANGFNINYIGFYYLTLFDLTTNSWRVPQQYNAPLDQHTAQTATYHPASKKIYYFGGSYYDSSYKAMYNTYFNTTMTFDTTSGQWGKMILNGSVIPSQRKMHTATLLSDGQTVLLYGGALDTKTVSDYCYTLNLTTMMWINQNLIAPLSASGPRSQHSAVLVNNSSLFILFGLNKTFNPTNDLLVLDVHNPQSISFANNYPFQTNTSSSSSHNNSGSDSSGDSADGSSSLSTGAIVGIIIGCGLLVIVVLAFIYYRRKDNKAKKENDGRQHKEDEILEVDWDKIDGVYYKEIDPPARYSQAIKINEESLHSKATLSTTKLYNADIEMIKPSSNVNIVKPSVANVIIVPHVIPEVVKPNVSLS